MESKQPADPRGAALFLAVMGVMFVGVIVYGLLAR